MTRHARQLVDAASMETPLGWILDPAMRVLAALLPCILQAAQLKSESNSTDSVTERLSSKYEVQLELATRHVISLEELEERLAAVVVEALKAAAAKHFRQPSVADEEFSWGTNATTQISKYQQTNEAFHVTFITFMNGSPVLGEVICEDLQLLSPTHISAVLHYPFTRALSQKEISYDAQNRWWIIALVFGVGLLIVLFGWFMLFIYYNSCGRPTAPVLSFAKTIYVKDEETQSTPKENVDRAAADEVERGSARNATGDALESPPLEATEEKPPAAEKLSEKKAPQQRGSRRLNPPPPLKLPSRTPSEDNPKAIDSWGIEDEGRRFEFREHEEGALKSRNRADRPKAAGKTRPLRTAEGKIVGAVPSSTGWYEYAAGDVMASHFGILPTVSWATSSNDHPHPSFPSSMGTVQFETNFNEDAKSSMKDVL